MKKPFQRVALFSRPQAHHDGITPTLEALLELLTGLGIYTRIESTTAQRLSSRASTLPHEQAERASLCDGVDLLIVVGGDGTLLEASRMALPFDVPLVGVNRGNLGFLADLLPDDIAQSLPPILQGRYEEEHRFLLHTRIMESKHCLYNDTALNDTVLLPGAPAHMIEFDILIDGRTVCTQRADGIIIATPTGSTAYALSASGPILHPQLNSVVLVPMFPHTLSSRPIVVSGNSTIALQISPDNRMPPLLSCDGLPAQSVNPGATVVIEKHAQALRLIHPMDYDYYSTLRSKLGWESRHARQ